jgi:hypothetical protein
MKKIIVFGFFAVLFISSLTAQQPERKPMPAADRAKSTIERISHSVTFTQQQKKDMIDIFTKFYEDVRSQQAFRDQTKMAPLEKARDAKVQKLLNNPKLYKQYTEAVVEMKAQYQERQRPPQQH